MGQPRAGSMPAALCATGGCEWMICITLWVVLSFCGVGLRCRGIILETARLLASGLKWNGVVDARLVCCQLTTDLVLYSLLAASNSCSCIPSSNSQSATCFARKKENARNQTIEQKQKIVRNFFRRAIGRRLTHGPHSQRHDTCPGSK